MLRLGALQYESLNNNESVGASVCHRQVLI